MGRGAHNLQLHGLPFKLNCPNLKVDANGANVAFGVCVVGETEQEARLSTEESVGCHGAFIDRAPTLPTPESPMSSSLKR